MPKTRKYRQFPADQKLAALRRYLVDKVPVSTLCEELKISPSLFHYWQQQLFANGAAAFVASSATPSREKALQARIDALEARLRHKDHVIAQVTEEYVGLKKELGES